MYGWQVILLQSCTIISIYVSSNIGKYEPKTQNVHILYYELFVSFVYLLAKMSIHRLRKARDCSRTEFSTMDV
jgi:hypothetical protein